MDSVILNGLRALLSSLLGCLFCLVFLPITLRELIYLFSPLFLILWVFNEWLDNQQFMKKRGEKKVED